MIVIILTSIISSFNLGLIGPLVLWNRIYNIGDSLSHALIMAVLISYFTNIPESISAIFVASLFVSFSYFFETKNNSQNLNMLILSSGLMALSLLVSDFFDISGKINNFIMGDIFSVRIIDLYISIFIMVILSIFIFYNFRKIVLLSLSEEIAHVSNINVFCTKLVLNIMLSLTIAISIQIIGVLLMSALLIIPSSISRIYSKSPHHMVFYSIIISMISCVFAIYLSYNFDVGLAPFYVSILFLFYALSHVYKKFTANFLQG